MSAQALAALDYARAGWRVFPCHQPGLHGCTCSQGADCPSPAKHPRTHRGLHDASADPATVARWWRRWPLANVGLRTGAGLVVLDVDPGHGGSASLAELEAAYGPMPHTRAVHTGGAGLHLYFRADHPVRNSAGALGPGLDVRGEGGYVIAPPSLHVSGSPYRWTRRGPIAAVPGWVLDRLAPPEPAPRGERPVPKPGRAATAWAAAALGGELDRVVAAPDGQRNHTLNRSAFALGQIVGAGHLDGEDVADLLRRAGEAAGLDPREVAATVASGLTAGQHWPRHPRPGPGATGLSPSVEATPRASVALDHPGL